MSAKEATGKLKVYVETTVISYLTAWPSRDVVVLGQQQTTREWWDKDREKFDLYTSQLVIQEAGAGDEQAARERLEPLATLPALAVSPEATALAKRLLDDGAFPDKAAVDALHVAIAATNGMDYLLTWNCRHLANATMRLLIEDVCREAGFEPPVICTPYELPGEEDNNE
jgi:hypothetical protein